MSKERDGSSDQSAVWYFRSSLGGRVIRSCAAVGGKFEGQVRVHPAESGEGWAGTEAGGLSLALAGTPRLNLDFGLSRAGRPRHMARARCSQKEKANHVSMIGLYLSRRRPTLPHTFACSTIGPAGLNFRVRYGNGWIPRGKITDKWSRQLSAVSYQPKLKKPSVVNYRCQLTA